MPQANNKQAVKQADKLLRDFLKEMDKIKQQAAELLSQAYKTNPSGKGGIKKK